MPEKNKSQVKKTRVPRPNLKDFAAALGISLSTVSRVLSGRAEQNRIAPATRQHILAEARKRGVMVDQLARSLRLQQTLTIGLLIPDISNPFFASFACLVERAARAHGYAVLLCDSQESTVVEAESVNLLQGRRVDGLIVAPVGETFEHLLPLQKAGVPMVLADRVFPQWEVPSVVSDNFGGARQAVEYLIRCGHRRVGCLQGLPQSYSNLERVRGYQAGLKAAGIPLEPDLLRGRDFSAESGYSSTLELCGSANRPTALLALGNLLALGAMRAIQERGLSVPKDISIISFDEQPWAAFLSPSLTTIAQPVESLANEAVTRLLECMRLSPIAADVRRLTPPKKSNVAVLPVDLVLRESVLKLIF
jgi:LacI family transcriptional regulator